MPPRRLLGEQQRADHREPPLFVVGLEQIEEAAR
jgi:hypothetical protein